jgi:hypothetical protein
MNLSTRVGEHTWENGAWQRSLTPTPCKSVPVELAREHFLDELPWTSMAGEDYKPFVGHKGFRKQLVIAHMLPKVYWYLSTKPDPDHSVPLCTNASKLRGKPTSSKPGVLMQMDAASSNTPLKCLNGP